MQGWAVLWPQGPGWALDVEEQACQDWRLAKSPAGAFRAFLGFCDGSAGHMNASIRDTCGPRTSGCPPVLKGDRLCCSRCHQPLAHKEAAAQDASWSAQGGLHRCLAPGPRGLLRGPRRPEGLPPPHRDQQEDLQDRPGLPHQGRQGGAEQRLHRLRPLQQEHQPPGEWRPAGGAEAELRRSKAVPRVSTRAASSTTVR